MSEIFRKSHRQVPATHEFGQAMTEFLVVLATLIVPMLIIFRIIGGLLFQQQRIELASRYSAWERTVWHQSAPSGPSAAKTVKHDDQVAKEIDLRVFSGDTAVLTSSMADDYKLDPFVYQLDGGRSSLIKELQESSEPIARYATASTAESEPGGLVGLMDDTFSLIGEATRFDLNQAGLYTTTVSVSLADLTVPFHLPGVVLDALTISRSSAIFGEAWTAGGSDRAEYLISGLLPQQFLDNGAVRTIQDYINYAPVARELNSDCLRFGHVDIDPLPGYRFAKYSNGKYVTAGYSPAGSGGNPCD